MRKDKNNLINPRTPLYKGGKITPQPPFGRETKSPHTPFVKGADKPSRFMVDLRKNAAEEALKKKGKKVDFGEMYKKLSELSIKKYLKGKKELIKNKKESIKEQLQKPVRIEKEKIKKKVNLPRAQNALTVRSGMNGIFREAKMPNAPSVSSCARGLLIKNAKSIDSPEKPFRPSIWQSILLFFHITEKARSTYWMYYDKLKSLFIFSALKFIVKGLNSILKLVYGFFYITGWLFLFLVRLIYFSALEVLKLFVSLIKIMVIGLEPLRRDAKLRFSRMSIINFRGSLLFKNCHFGLDPEFRSDSAVQGLAEKNWILNQVQDDKKYFKKPGEFPIKEMKLAEIERELESGIKILEANKEKEISPPAPFIPVIRRSGRGGIKIRNIIPRPGLHLLKPTLVFAVTLFLLVLPFKVYTYYKSLDLDDLRIRVLGASFDAMSAFKSASQEASEFNFNQANRNFSKAASQFLEAQNELKSVNNFLFVLASIAPDKDLRLAAQSKNILSAGEIASSLGSNLSLAVDSLFNNNENGNIKDIIDNFILYGEKAKADADQLRITLSNISIDDLPEEYREQFAAAKEKTPFLEDSLIEFVELARNLQTFLGMSDNRRYLLVFQNNAELRATGGFIGSFALIDFRNGAIKNIEAPGGGSYDTEAGLNDLVAAPGPLHLVNPLWHFWDANWWPDWPRSAKKLAWFYEHSDGPTVDGVIGLTPTIVERLLHIIGPLDMTERYGVIITAENFYEIAQNFSEQKNTDKPKEIIGDLLAKIIEELPAKLNRENIVALTKALEESLAEKHILLYFSDNELKEKVERYGWGGELRHTSWDYISVINTNIAGGKSDRKIRETINHEAEVKSDGSIIDTIEIKREHTGEKLQSFSGARNVNWMRIYVPLGSKLLEAGGFKKPDEIYFEEPEANWQKDEDVLAEETEAIVDEQSGTKIYTEDGKTVFANWSMVDPGETSIIRLRYILPFKLTAPATYKLPDKIMEVLSPSQKAAVPYALLAQKQSGTLGSIIKSELKLPSNMQIIWHYPEGMSAQVNGWQVGDALNIDKYWAAIINIKN